MNGAPVQQICHVAAEWFEWRVGLGGPQGRHLAHQHVVEDVLELRRHDHQTLRTTNTGSTSRREETTTTTTKTGTGYLGRFVHSPIEIFHSSSSRSFHVKTQRGYLASLLTDINWPVSWLHFSHPNCTQEKRSLHSRWNFIPTLTELHGHGDDRWPTEVTSATYLGGAWPHWPWRPCGGSAASCARRPWACWNGWVPGAAPCSSTRCRWPGTWRSPSRCRTEGGTWTRCPPTARRSSRPGICRRRPFGGVGSAGCCRTAGGRARRSRQVGITTTMMGVGKIRMGMRAKLRIRMMIRMTRMATMIMVMVMIMVVVMMVKTMMMMMIMWWWWW